MPRNDPTRKPTTLADAIYIAEQSHVLSERAQILVHVRRMNLNSGKHLHLVVLELTSSLPDESAFIPLQSGNTFLAIDNLTGRRREYAAELLDGAKVSNAVVTLLDGTKLRAVEIAPNRLPYELSPKDEKIIYAAISVAKIEGAVYRSFRHGLSEEDAKRIIYVESKSVEFGEFVDRLKFIDFGKLAQIEIQPLLLLNIRGEFAKLFPDEKSPSEQKISDTLSLAGFWKPKRRPKS